ncbi:MAG: zinc finger domain-containing protein [Candidatus Aenigmarchaeota archaeon]|nr:zinc finger domain-containing protein [Candidatus Aenigmarchaeota archaeon]
MKCTSCHENLLSEDNFTKFKCPSCLKVELVRCESCRKKSNIYVCSKCGFEGP